MSYSSGSSTSSSGPNPASTSSAVSSASLTPSEWLIDKLQQYGLEVEEATIDALVANKFTNPGALGGLSWQTFNYLEQSSGTERLLLDIPLVDKAVLVNLGSKMTQDSHSTR